MKKCRKCNKEKSLSCFGKVKARKNKEHSWCKECCAANVRERYKKDPSCWRNAYLKNNFSISEVEYSVLFDAQKGVCAICFESDQSGRRLAVDHDHKTGAVRGLLCSQCNIGLGNFKDDARRLEKALVYLNSPRKALTCKK